MLVGPKEWQTQNLLPVTVKEILHYGPMGWQNLLAHMFSSLFTQLKVVKG